MASSAEYDILYFAECIVFAIFAAKYTHHEYNHWKKE